MVRYALLAFATGSKNRQFFAQQYGGREQYGMFACDPDGSNLLVINKLERVEATADGMGQGDAPSGERDLPKTLVNLLPKDPDHILMNRLRGNSGLGDVIKVNIRNGREVVHESNYINARVWIADSSGEVRVAICTDFTEPVRIKYRRNAKEEWRVIGEFSREISMLFEEASPIQTAVIPAILTGRDVVGQSSTGSGKTASFILPALEKIIAARGDNTKRREKGVIYGPRVLVLAAAYFFVVTGNYYYLIILFYMKFHSSYFLFYSFCLQHFGGKRNNFHELFIAKFTGYRSENTGTSRFVLCIQ